MKFNVLPVILLFSKIAAWLKFAIRVFRISFPLCSSSSISKPFPYSISKKLNQAKIELKVSQMP